MLTMVTYNLWYAYACASDAPNMLAERVARFRSDRSGSDHLTGPVIALIVLAVIGILVGIYFLFVKQATTNVGNQVTSLSNTGNTSLGGIN
ncbi:MAG: hypothetical protein ACYCTG_05450 [Ferrimicrobium sp.]